MQVFNNKNTFVETCYINP